jgi:carbamoyltransferase
LLKDFEQLTGLPILLNTSFNVKGQPIVCTPQEALDTFLVAKLDALVMGDFVVTPKSPVAAQLQPAVQEPNGHKIPKPELQTI